MKVVVIGLDSGGTQVGSAEFIDPKIDATIYETYSQDEGSIRVTVVKLTQGGLLASYIPPVDGTLVLQAA